MTLSESTLSAALNFDLVEILLLDLNAIMEPAEFHGTLCGQLCAGERYEKRAWLQQSLQILDIEDIPDAQGASIYQFYQAGLALLADNEYGFQLVLPSDDTAILIRLEHLVHWCEGFLGGYGYGLMNKKQCLSADLQQILEDLAAIAQVEVNADDSDENENHYMELVEFVRMAVLNIFLDISHTNDKGIDGVMH